MDSDQVRMRRPEGDNEAQHRRSLSIGKKPTVPLELDDESRPSVWGNVATFLGGPWVRMVIFVMACFFTAPLYYGWQQYALMLGRSGAYSWLCNEGDTSGDEVFDCNAQSVAVSRLYSIAAGCEYASAAWGGIFLDSAGPRISGLVGELGWVVGTIMIMVSSQSVQLYIPGMIVLGSSVNVLFFPSLVTIESWPQWRGLMVGLALAASTAATLIPPVMWSMWEANPHWTFLGIWSVYIAAIWAPITLLYVIALPGARDYQKILKIQRRELLALKAKTQQDSVSTNAELEDSPERQASLALLDEDGRLVQREATWGEFLRNIITLDMVVMAIFYFIIMGMYAYYPTVVRDAIGAEFSEFLGWFQPTQAIWSLMVGFLCDWCLTAWVMTAMCSMCGAVFIISIAAAQGSAAHYVAGTLLTISQCAVFAVKYTYVSEMFDPYHYGKLVGWLGVLGGIGTFMNIPISASPNYNAVFVTYLSIMPVLIGMVLWLGWRQTRGQTYKTLPDPEAQLSLLPNEGKSIATGEV